MSDLWMDLSNVEAERRLEAVTAVRVATASLWPILAGATDRDDFANRMELVRGRLATAAQDPGILGAVEASLVNDFEMLLSVRKEAEVSEKKRKDAEEKGDTLPGTDKFPIENKKDLENAKHDIGRTNEPKGKVERYINERAKELGAPGIGGKAAAKVAKGPKCPLCGSGPDTDEHYDDVHANEGVPSHWSDPSNDWGLYDHHSIADQSYPANDAGMDVRRSASKTAANGYSYASGMGPRERKPWRPTHVFSPNGWDMFDPKPHAGSSPIAEGELVFNHGFMSPRGPGGMRLIHIEDRHGNHQTVDQRSVDRYSGKEASLERQDRESSPFSPLLKEANTCPICGNPGHGEESHDPWEDAVEPEMRDHGWISAGPHDDHPWGMHPDWPLPPGHHEAAFHDQQLHQLRANTDTECDSCGQEIRAGENMAIDPVSHKYLCSDCAPQDFDYHHRLSSRQASYSDEFPHLRHMQQQHPQWKGHGLDPEAAHKLMHDGDWSNPGIDQGVMSSHPDLAEHEKYPGLYDLSVDLGRRFLSAKAISDEDISNAYERHIQWSRENGHDPDTIKALREHEKSKGISRRMADGIADLTGIGGGGPDWRTGHHYEAALADVPAAHIPELNHVHTDHLTDDELMAHLRHEHGLNIEPYRKPNERSHALDHLLEPFGEDGGPVHNHGGQYESFLDSPIQPVASAQEMEMPRGEPTSHTAASNLYEPEYEEGLECPHAPYCNWKGFTDAKRQEHIQNRHGGAMPGAKKSASVIDQVTLDAVADAGLFGAEVKALPAGEPRRSFLSRMFRRAKNDENLKEKCPICGKEIPAAEMANHMKKDHPHQAIKPDDANRARDHAEKQHHHADMNTQAPASTATTAPEDDPSLTPMEDNSIPSNLNPKVSARLDMIERIALDLYRVNPGLTETQRIHLATRTVDRYPQLIAEGRGGADYVEGETLSMCSQCGKPTFSEAVHTCHNCGFVRA